MTSWVRDQSRSTKVLSLIAILAVIVSLIFAGRPWYSYGSDAFTDSVNGWNACTNMHPTASFEIFFLALLSVEVFGAVLARRKGRVRILGLVITLLTAVPGLLFALQQLDGATTGGMCAGYNFDVLRAVTISSTAMITVHVAVALLATASTFRRFRARA